MICSFSNTTSDSTFYAFFSSFLITLWPMWLANSKLQPCFYPPWSHAQQDTHNWQKNWQTWWETYAVPENIQFSFRVVFLHSYTAQFNLECMGPFRVCGALTWRYPSASDHFNHAYKETRLTDFADLLLVNEWCHEFVTHCWHLMIEQVTLYYTDVFWF